MRKLMWEWCVSFQSDAGKLGVIVLAESPEQAVTKVKEKFSLGLWECIEAIKIIIKQRGRITMTLKVQIQKCNINTNAWYKDEVGYIYEVADKLTELNGHICYQVIQNNEVTSLRLIVNDCQIV